MGKIYRYPKKSRYLKFQKRGNMVWMKHILSEEEWTMPVHTARFIKALDGKKNPYQLGYDCNFADDILDFMEEEELLDDGKRILNLDIGTVLFAVWIPEIRQIHRVAGFLWNHFLMAVWIPALILGLFVAFNGNYTCIGGEGWGIISGWCAGMATGMILHELSHAAATLNYKGTLCEAGIMIRNFMPGGYCLIDYENVKDRFRRAQINAAGVESNMFLCGCFLCMLKSGLFSFDFLICAAGVNAYFGVFNLALFDGMDGTGVLEEFLGCSQFVTRAKALVSDRTARARLRKKGINGYAEIVVCHIICALQILQPMILILGFVSIIYIFIS